MENALTSFAQSVGAPSVPRATHVTHSTTFPLSVLFGLIWCSLVLFGPKIYFVNRGSFDMPGVPIIPLNPEPGGLFSGPLYLWRS